MTPNNKDLHKKGKRLAKYNQESLNLALTEVRKHKSSYRKAAAKYGIPLTTLHDKVTGKTSEVFRKMGPQTTLSEAEEKKIVDWLVGMAKCGFPRKPQELLNVVKKIVTDEKRVNSFKDNRPGRKWLTGFISRHPELSMRTPEAISKGQSNVTKSGIRCWFENLKSYLIDENCLNILDDPSRIFNGDETCFNLSPKTGIVIGPKGYKNVLDIKNVSEKENITVFLVFSANGATLPPLIIYPYVRPPSALVNRMPDSFVLGLSESGWMRSSTFYEYIANNFDKWLTAQRIQRPVLLLVDGYKSHLSLEVSEFCANQGIILYALPPNCTHILQPADVGAFRPLKQDYKTTLREWESESGKTLSKINFAEVLQCVLQKDRSEIVKNSFRKCGFYLWNPDAPDYSKCVKDQLSLQKDTVPQSEKSPSDDKFEIAKEVISHLKTDLFNSGIDYLTILQTISNAQINNHNNTNTSTSLISNRTEEVQIDDSIRDNLNIDDNINELPDNEEYIVFDFDEQFNSSFHEIVATSEYSRPNHDPQEIDESSEILNLSNIQNHPKSPTLENSFEKYLKFPEPLTSNRGKTVEVENRPPMAISAKEWRDAQHRKHQIKEKKKSDLLEKKQLRLQEQDKKKQEAFQRKQNRLQIKERKTREAEEKKRKERK